MSKDQFEKAAFEGELKIGDIVITCYVLSSGQRLLSQSAMIKALGMSRGSSGGTSGDRLAKFTQGNVLKPFIDKGLDGVTSTPIKFITTKGNWAYGYDAEVLQSIVKSVTKAYLKGKLLKNQEHIGRRAELLDDSFSKIGLIALVDEATGYQYVREKDELQKILKAYISEELLPWQKKFPDVFYKELFRLNGWNFTVNGIKKRPGVIGRWTNSLIYEQLPKGVLSDLKNKTPKSAAGNYTAKFFQSLTPDTGDPHLTAQIQQVITLFMLSDNMKDMWSKFEKLRARQAGQLELPFEFDKEGHTKEPSQEVYKYDELSGFNKDLKKALSFDPKDKNKKS